MKIILNDGRVFNVGTYHSSYLSLDNPMAFAYCGHYSDMSRNTLRAFSYALGMKYYYPICITAIGKDGLSHSIREYHSSHKDAVKRIKELDKKYSRKKS